MVQKGVIGYRIICIIFRCVLVDISEGVGNGVEDRVVGGIFGGILGGVGVGVVFRGG
ncbi:YitT family protein, partial [Priestia megaterium]|uniref:YitT family protein n=1 Tax=Priestia megaterium TaxID=1404 RepID=UPI001649A11A